MNHIPFDTLKIIPRFFQYNTILAGQAISSIFNITIPTSVLKEYIIQAYEWSSYDEFKNNPKSNKQLIKELDLSHDSYHYLLLNVCKNLLAAVIQHKASSFNIDNIEHTNADQIPKELSYHIEHIKNEFHKNISGTYFYKRYCKNLRKIKKNDQPRVSFEVDAEQLGGGTLFIQRNDYTRMSNLLSVYTSVLENESRGLWFITESECAVIKMLFANINQDHLIFLDNHPMDFSLEHFFDDNNKFDGKHWFLIYPDGYPSSPFSKTICDPDALFKKYINTILSPVNVFPSHLSANVKRAPFKFLYLNTSIVVVSQLIGSFFAQARAARLSVAISITNVDPNFLSSLVFKSIQANSNITVIDGDETQLLDKYSYRINLKRYVAFRKCINCTGSSIFMNSRGFDNNINHNIVMVDENRVLKTYL